ncbi:MAG: NusA-like transcription termination signal-binding factor [Candidatus Bathyarchaeia archaeon]
MSNKIRLTSNEMRYIALFENITGAMAHDCIIDDKTNRIILIVRSGDIGLAIGKRGSKIKMLRRMTGKDIDLVEYAENPTDFIKNAFAPARTREVRIIERLDGKKIAIVTIEPHDKGVAIGKNGKTAERTRFLAKRYFAIDNVIIT